MPPKKADAKSSGGSGDSSRSTRKRDDSSSSGYAAELDGVMQGELVRPDDMDPKLINAIRWCIREENADIRSDIKSIKKRLDKFDKLSQEITSLKSTMESVESGLQFASNKLDHMEEKVIPAVSRLVSTTSQRLLHETLKMDAHRRKWNVVLHGVDGPAGEEESATLQAVKDFAQSALKLTPEEVAGTTFHACHRLSNKENAGIIVRFVDLSYRDKWLSGARNIQSYIESLSPPVPNKKISLAIDLPPKIRPLKDSLMKKRKDLPLAKRKKSKLRYLAQWPFVELRVDGETPIRPTESLSDITKSILGLDLDMAFPRFENG